MMTHITRIVIGAGIVVAILAPALQLALQIVSYAAGAIAYLLVLTLFGGGLWVFFRLTRSEFGWCWGRPSDYALAVIYPTVVVLGLSGLAMLSGKVETSTTFEAATMLRDFAIMAAATFVAVLITEEGYFRGALWGAAKRADWSNVAILFWTTLCFTAWHLAVPFVDEKYQVPIEVMPVYFANATLISLAFGILRLGSGSILTASVAHATWNGFSYVLFGYGEKAGALGIEEFGMYGPERGIWGLVVNGLVLLALTFWVKRRLAY